MINSIIDSTRKRVGYGFPRLMINEGSPYFLIVLFDRPGQGMVVAKTEVSARYEVGAYRRDFDMSEFVDFNGTIELSNLP